MCRLDLASTSPRPQPDRCQAMLNDFSAPPGAESPKCDFEQPSTVLNCFLLPKVPKWSQFVAFVALGHPLGLPSDNHGCQLSDVSVTVSSLFGLTKVSEINIFLKSGSGQNSACLCWCSVSFFLPFWASKLGGRRKKRRQYCKFVMSL